MPADIALYEHPLSPYAQKIRILLREKNLPFELATPANVGSGASGGGLADLNPRLEVPALTHNGRTYFDSTIILEYLEETFPNPPMMPKEPADRARARMIEEVCDTHWEAINWGLGEVRFFGRGGETLGPQLRAAAEAQLAHLYAWLDGELGGAQWLNGDRFGWADLAALPYVTMSRLFGIPPTTARLSAWLARCEARPSVSKTVEEALATIPFMEQLGGILSSGAFKRQFRDHRLEWMIRSGGVQVVLDGLKNDDIRFTDLALFAQR